MAVVVIRAPTDEIPVHDARLVNKNAAAHFEIEPALGNRRHAPTLDAAGVRGDFHAMANRGDRLSRIEEVPRDTDEIFVVANVFGRSTTAEKDSQVIFRGDFAERHFRIDRIALPLPGDRPAGFHFVQHQLVFLAPWTSQDRSETRFLQPVVGIQRIERLRGIADNQQNSMGIGFQALCSSSGNARHRP